MVWLTKRIERRVVKGVGAIYYRGKNVTVKAKRTRGHLISVPYRQRFNASPIISSESKTDNDWTNEHLRGRISVRLIILKRARYAN